MATVNGFSYTHEGSLSPAYRYRPGVPVGGAVTTYCYRESDGTRGYTTDLDAIPAGAEIERVVTT